MNDQPHRIVYPTVGEFYDGLRVYIHHCPRAIFREVRDPKQSYLGVTDGSVTHVITMETFKAFYAIVHFSDPEKQRRSFADHQETVKLILGDSLKAHRHVP
jgi:hypothetical protein